MAADSGLDLPPLAQDDDDRWAEVERTVSQHLIRLRRERRLSLDALARRSGVSRAMLAQIESGRSVPSIRTLYKIAVALKVSVAAFLRQSKRRTVEVLPASSAHYFGRSDGRVTWRALFPPDSHPSCEFYELRLAGLEVEPARPCPAGAIETLVVAQGQIELSVDHRNYPLQQGDAVVFDADQAHRYRNLATTESVLFVTVNLAERQEEE